MIKMVMREHYDVRMDGSPMFHENLMWYATEDDSRLGVVILDRVDHDFSWVMMMKDVPDQGPGYTAVDLDHSLPTVEAATAGLHRAMEGMARDDGTVVAMGGEPGASAGDSE